MVGQGMSWLVFAGLVLGGFASLLWPWLTSVRALGRPLQAGAQRKSASWAVGLSCAGAIAVSIASVISLIGPGEAPGVFRHGFALGFWTAGLWGAFLGTLLYVRLTPKTAPSAENSR